MVAEAPNGNNVTPFPISGPEQSMDLNSEGDRGYHNKEIARYLHGAPEQAEATDQPREPSQASHYPGQSEMTMSRNKQA